MRYSTNFTSPIRSRNENKKVAISLLNTPILTPARVNQGLDMKSKHRRTNTTRVPTLEMSSISIGDQTVDNLFEMGTKRSSKIFNGRVVNFWD